MKLGTMLAFGEPKPHKFAAGLKEKLSVFTYKSVYLLILRIVANELKS